MALLDRLKAAVGGATAPAAQVMSVTGPEPCEDCGATPADDLVGVRWLCSTCAPAARLEESSMPHHQASEPEAS